MRKKPAIICVTSFFHRPPNNSCVSQVTFLNHWPSVCLIPSIMGTQDVVRPCLSLYSPGTYLTIGSLESGPCLLLQNSPQGTLIPEPEVVPPVAVAPTSHRWMGEYFCLLCKLGCDHVLVDLQCQSLLHSALLLSVMLCIKSFRG